MFPVTTHEDMEKRGIEQLDVIIVSGDAYVDHPSFGPAVIVRLLESLGLSVGLIAQPEIADVSDISRLGEPKLFFGVSAGNVDSMVANYSSAKVKRNWDDYSGGGIGGKRPNRAVVVYCNLLRRAFGKTPIIIGGIEASLRRFTHYDYWQDKL
ncbi:MAG: YgiQ family radical SAM protein, partial [Planctomycetes bacterium]|nr:YgiQ family radical SAM protein [Planctomycetota bacterium]